jgi:hypothetical protein
VGPSGIPHLYVWSKTSVVEGGHALDLTKGGYLSTPFFTLRLVLISRSGPCSLVLPAELAPPGRDRRRGAHPCQRQGGGHLRSALRAHGHPRGVPTSSCRSIQPGTARSSASTSSPGSGRPASPRSRSSWCC